MARYDYNDISPAEYQITKAHQDLVAACDLGDIDIIGDSTSNADLIPSRIGARVRVLGLGGGTPVELYYVVQSLLKCKNLPQAVILAYVPSSFGSDPAFPYPEKTYFWEKSFPYRIVNFRDAMEILRNSKRFGSVLFSGPASSFDVDYRIKAYLYAARFPVYLRPDLQHHLIEFLLGRNARDLAVNLALYQQTLADAGHHFYGTEPKGGAILDHDADRTNDGISALTDFYLRRTIQALADQGIKVFFVEPPRAQTSFVEYPAALVEIYQRYLEKLQLDEPGLRVIGNGFQVWDTVLFGDESHLNLRGSLIFSAQIRNALDAADMPWIFAPAALNPQNIYANARFAKDFWIDPAGDPVESVAPVNDDALPDLAYPASRVVWRYQVQPLRAVGGDPEIEAGQAVLAGGTNYAISVMVRTADADSLGLRIDWPGGFKGKVDWNFAQRTVRYSGNASALNSGVSLCRDGWVELFLSGSTGPMTGPYSGMFISLSAPQGAVAELNNLALERGLWPVNYCRLQPGEAKIILPSVRNTMAN